MENVHDLPENTVDIWLTNSHDVTYEDLRNQYLPILSEDELERHSKFVYQKDKHQYLVTHVLTRYVLSEYLPHIPPSDWQFNHSKHGKPSIRNEVLPFALNFNISKSHGTSVVAITREFNVGVDVELINSEIQPKEIAQYFFSVKEASDLNHLSGHLIADRFFSLWTLKEAYIKAKGLGFAIPLDQFSFDFDDGFVNISFDKALADSSRDWFFWQASLPLFKLSVALEKGVSRGPFIVRLFTGIPFGEFKSQKLSQILTSETIDTA